MFISYVFSGIYVSMCSKILVFKLIIYCTMYNVQCILNEHKLSLITLKSDTQSLKPIIAVE